VVQCFHLGLFLLLFAGRPALAGPNEGGTLIVHRNASLVYTAEQNYCGQSDLGNCEDAVVSAPADPESVVVFHLLAAFPAESSPRLKGLSFGIEYDPERLALVAHGPCIGDLDNGAMEYPGANWPESGTGTSLVFQTTQTSAIVESYWFAGYAYTGVDSVTFRVVAHPDERLGGTLADDAIPSELDPIAAYGRFGFGTPGYAACPSAEDGPGGGGSGDDDGDAPQQGEGEHDGPNGPPALAEYTFIEMTTTTDSTFAVEARALRSEYGLRILVGLSPDGLFCGPVAQATQDALEGDARVNQVTDAEIPGLPDVTADDLEAGDPGFAARVWNASFEAAPPDSAPSRGFSSQESCIMYEGEEEGRAPRGSEQTSTYMLGDIGVSILFMESTRSGPCQAPDYPEDWTVDERNTAFTLIEQGLQDLVDLAEDGRATFWFVETEVCSTTVEPIQLEHDNSTWVSEAMIQLGFTGGSYTQKMRALCNQRRTRSDTPYDWWFITFVIADDCDFQANGAGQFEDNFISFASIGGPRMTLLYLNGSGQTYQLDDLDLVAAHEVCHVFGAPDEYIAEDDCDRPYGYLRVPNANDTTCVQEQTPCLMDNGLTFELCPYTRAHIGWRDSDDPHDHVYDPIDHPDSYMSVLVGAADSLGLGDYVDIYSHPSCHDTTCVKRIVASRWSSDRGRLLWDGIGYEGLPRSPGAYYWKRNGGQTAYTDSLLADTEPPVIMDLTISPGTGIGSFPSDTLSFRFQDEDTDGGRVRAMASMPGLPDKWIVEDRFYRETEDSSITQTYKLPHDGLWTVTLRIWDVGAGHETTADSSYWHGSLTGIGGQRLFVPELTLSRSRPNPSGAWVSWDLQLPSAGQVDLRVVGVDGRAIKTWSDRGLPGGVTRILWDGRTGTGARASSGRYYLVVTDKSGKTVSMPATILR